MSKIYAMGPINGMQVEPVFDHTIMSAEGGLNFFSEAERCSQMLKQIASKIPDNRVQGRVTHSLADLLKLRVYGICSANYACSDVDRKKSDYMFKMSIGRDPEDGDTLPSTATFCRFENQFNLSQKEVEKMGDTIIDGFCDHAYEGKEPESMCIDVDETFVELFGNQTEMCYNKHYSGRGTLPMHFYDFATKWCLKVVNRPAKTPTGEESSTNIAKVVDQIRKHFFNTTILIRGDSHYCVREVVKWCLKRKKTEYIFGLSQNNVLNNHPNVKRNETKALEQAKKNKADNLEATATTYSELRYVSKKWNCPKQRVIIRSTATEVNGKYTVKSRYVMTSIQGGNNETIYKDYYSPRGQAENFIKEHKSQLRSDRTSCLNEAANQMRLHLHTMAHNLFCIFRNQIPMEFQLRKAEVRTLQRELIRVPVEIKKTKSRILLIYPESFKYEKLYLMILDNIRKNVKRRNRYP